jgi:hypothetical protein
LYQRPQKESCKGKNTITMTIIDMGNDALAAQNRDESSMNSNLSHADTLLSDAECSFTDAGNKHR